MSKEKHNIYHGQFLKNLYGDLVPATPADQMKYKAFKEAIEPSQVVEIFMEANEDNGTVPQLARIHVCIRELAKEIGYTFEDMKLEVKHQAGLCVKKEIGDELFMVCKSFAKCSKDELGLVIQAINQIGETVNINFH